MNIALNIDDFHLNNIYFNEPIENTIIEDSKFIKLIYSNNDVVLNGLFLFLNIKPIQKEVYFKKIKYFFDLNNNTQKLNKIFQIEESILNLYNNNKNKKTIIKDVLKSGILKLFPNYEDEIQNNRVTNDVNNFILKISGIWENNEEIGITYKIIPF
tara:strand:+ start:589 stop:1056 length:468 start_codon:yes stop_codon:yes gene_type:complete